MRRYSQRHNLGTLAELNVTPLLDLAFVLLIIFMITTPLMEKNVDVVLPTANPASGATLPPEEENISITKDDVIKLNNEVVSLDQLEAQLTALKKSQPNIAVVIRPHKDLTVQKLTDVTAAILRAGITRTALVTNPDSD
jgi:biopolymer transport protein ExbD